MTYRWREHVGPGHDYHLGYRTEDEAQPWMANDQVTRLAALIAPAERAAIKAEVEAEIAAAFAFAEASPFPAPARTDHRRLQGGPSHARDCDHRPP